MEDEPLFANLKSDAELRRKIEILNFENPKDKSVVEMLLEKQTLCKSQRDWFKGLIARQGRKFTPPPKK